MTRQYFLYFALASMMLVGCANATFNFTDKSPTESDKAKVDQHQPNFLSGFGALHTIDVVKVCGSIDKVASVEVDQSFLDSVLALVTWGIYTPLSARVYCK